MDVPSSNTFTPGSTLPFSLSTTVPVIFPVSPAKTVIGSTMKITIVNSFMECFNIAILRLFDLIIVFIDKKELRTCSR